jgi:hypothetical protein
VLDGHRSTRRAGHVPVRWRALDRTGGIVVASAPNDTDTMALTDTDRRRFYAATVLTLLALPALWWANTSDNSSAPGLAVAGIDPGVDVPTASSPSPQPAAAAKDPSAEIGDAAPLFLEGPMSAPGAGQVEVAVPAKPLVDGVSAQATFRSTVAPDRCIVAGLASGTPITVVNLDNNRTITCTSLVAPGSEVGELIMHTSVFSTIADLTDAPISVEIRR